MITYNCICIIFVSTSSQNIIHTFFVPMGSDVVYSKLSPGVGNKAKGRFFFSFLRICSFYLSRETPSRLWNLFQVPSKCNEGAMTL